MTEQATRQVKIQRLALAALFGTLPAATAAQTAPAQPAPLAAAPAQSTLAQIPGVTVQYYDVRGATIPEIRQSIAAQRPAGAGGNPVPASSSWSIGTSLRRSTTGNKCRVIGANARLRATVIMPRLVGVETVPEPVLRQWQTYVAGLEQQQVALLRPPLSRLGEVERAATSSTCQGAADAVRRAITAITTQTAAPAAANPASAGS